MLIEIWERLRGYDKWIQTDATIMSSDLVGQLSKNVIGWNDESGKSHRAMYSVHSSSRLYQLYDGQTVTIRYNHANPDQYSFHALLQSKFDTLFSYTVLYIIFLFPFIKDFFSFFVRHLH
jgi:hypothetical protein